MIALLLALAPMQDGLPEQHYQIQRSSCDMDNEHLHEVIGLLYERARISFKLGDYKGCVLDRKAIMVIGEQNESVKEEAELRAKILLSDLVNHYDREG